MESITAKIIGIARHRLSTDGDGVTTLVAFHGCPLRCHYCLNPQSVRPETECRTYTPQELYNTVLPDQLYFLATGGGIMFGGGEPCLQSDFICQFRMLCGEQWQIGVETSLNISRKHLEKLLPIVDRYIIDIKDMNPIIYEKYTLRSNNLMLDNLQ